MWMGVSGLAMLGGYAIFSTGHGEEITIGSEIPPIKVVNDEGRSVDLAREGADGWVLVYFYPKANTPGCTSQACSLRDEFEELTSLGVKVFGVSCDSVAAQKRFKAKRNLPFSLLADTERTATKAFGVKTHFGRFPARQAFLFHNGHLEWRDLSASTSKQAADVLAVIKASS